MLILDRMPRFFETLLFQNACQILTEKWKDFFVFLLERKSAVRIERADLVALSFHQSDFTRIFDKFYPKSIHQNTGSHRGTGLGLAISKRYSRGHGGYIGVTSVRGCRERILFRVPMAIGRFKGWPFAKDARLSLLLLAGAGHP